MNCRRDAFETGHEKITTETPHTVFAIRRDEGAPRSPSAPPSSAELYWGSIRKTLKSFREAFALPAFRKLGKQDTSTVSRGVPILGTSLALWVMRNDALNEAQSQEIRRERDGRKAAAAA